MIDTQIWVIAKKKPSPNRFPSQREYEEALRAHEQAREFLVKEHAKARIYVSAHQLAEIYHALAFRGFRVPLNEARAFIEGIATDPNIYIVPATRERYRSSVDERSSTPPTPTPSVLQGLRVEAGEPNRSPRRSTDLTAQRAAITPPRGGLPPCTLAANKASLLSTNPRDG